MKTILTIFVLLYSLPVFSQDTAIVADIQKAFHDFNVFRRSAGLDTVTLSSELSDACTAHAKYLVLNWGHEKTTGVNAHKEFEELPGYSMKGFVAGRHSVIAYESPSSAIASWASTFYHRIPFLQPDLKEIGIGYASTGSRSVALLNCVPGKSSKTEIEVVVYPAVNQVDVPLAMRAKEIPNPLPDSMSTAGFPITIYFANRQKVEDATCKLTDRNNKNVACFVSSPQQPATAFSQWNSICAIPVKPLVKNSKYFVMVKCSVNGKPYQKKYSFTTVK